MTASRPVPDAHLDWPVPVVVAARRTALLLIDFQRQFLDPTSPLAVEGSDALVDRANETARRVRVAGGLVIWVQQHIRTTRAAGLTSSRFGVGDIHTGDGSTLDDRLDIAADDVIVTKPRQSAFYGTDLDVVLRSAGVRSVAIGGVTTNVCVMATAKDASERDFSTHVVADLTLALPIGREGGRRLEANAVRDSALAFVQYAYGNVTTTEQLRLEAPADAS